MKINNKELDLTIKQINISEVNRGWIRLNKSVRGDEIKREIIYKIEIKDKSVYRMVLGENTTDENLLIDTYTRDKLSIFLEHQYKVKFSKANLIERIIFYWNHPDYTFKAGYRLAWVLGGLSIILGGLSIILSVLR